MLKGGNPLTVGVGIIIEVIRKNNSDYDLENQIGPVPKCSDPIYLGTLLRQFAKNIPQFMELVHNPNHTVTNKDGTKATRKRELKTAFGEKIEPLGFDRFKTCELMAELLHCSNMALLNERGSEAEVKRRDSERERLRAEGKLSSKANLNVTDFSTSVDSHGFHHARAPSCESPEEVKRLEVQNNADEEEFEKVTASEALPDPSTGSVDDKTQIGEPLERSPNIDLLDPQSTRSTDAGDDLSSEALSTPEAGSPAAPPKSNTSRASDDAESPTSAGLSAKVGGLDLDNDTVMESGQGQTSDTTSGEEQSERQSLLTQQLSKTSGSEGVNSPEGESPVAGDDKPAPLFSGKQRNPPSSNDADLDPSRFTSNAPESEESEVTPIDESSSSRSVVFGVHEGQHGPQYEVDIDGSPVVGDLLKMMFVDHKVVPTILVSSLAWSIAIFWAGLLAYTDSGFLFSLSLE